MARTRQGRTAWPDNPFWDYSVALYRRPGVETACLGLQRRHGLDVNLVLLGCWLASRGIVLDRATLEGVEQAVSDWRADVIMPLRALRRRLAVGLDRAVASSIPALWPDQTAALRQRVLAVELDGEHLAQLALCRLTTGLVPSARPGVGLASVNLDRCQRFWPEDRADLETLLGAAFPDAAPDDIADALNRIGA